MKHIESQIQKACVNWFRTVPKYKKIQNLLFAVPNGGKRNAFEAKIMKAEGVTAGVSDLILLMSNGFYHSLCIEIKTPIGTQTPKQIDFETAVVSHGHKYIVIRSVTQFMVVIENYLNGLI
jgi:hypothetical protein